MLCTLREATVRGQAANIIDASAALRVLVGPGAPEYASPSLEVMRLGTGWKQTDRYLCMCIGAIHNRHSMDGTDKVLINVTVFTK